MQITLNEMIDNPFNQEQINVFKNKSKKQNKKNNIFTFLWFSLCFFMAVSPSMLINYNAFNLIKTDYFPLLAMNVFILVIVAILSAKINSLKNNILTIDNINFNNTIDFNTINLNTENILATNKKIHQFIKNIQSQNRDLLSFEKNIIERMLKL